MTTKRDMYSSFRAPKLLLLDLLDEKLFCCITCPKVLLSDHLLKDSDLQTRNVHREDKSFRDMYVICQKE
ncbi:unnamed protein product [Musa acuminata var. zebrina]